MHMLRRKDLNSAELDTVRASRNPATVIIASGEVQTNEEATVYVYDFDLFVTVHILESSPQSYRLENSAKIMDIPMSGLLSKSHISKKNCRKSKCTDRCPRCCHLALPVQLQVHVQHCHRRTPQKIPRQVQRPYDVEVPAVQQWETSCAIPST